ncbi:MAG: hypothetical protein E6Q40_10710, partial [Cupriavidus sp.]
MREGTFAFDLKGKNFTFADLVLGSGLSVGVAQFVNTDAANATVSIGGITLQSNSGSYNVKNLVTNLEGNVGPNVTLELRGGVLNIGGASVGINNHVYLGSGETASIGYDIVLNAGNASGSSNNRLEVDGGTLNTGVITVGGLYDASNPSDIVRANNQVVVHENGNLKITAGSADLLTVGSGSELRTETGGKIVLDYTLGAQSNLNIAEHGQLILNGAGSQISATAASGYKLNVAGSAEVSDGASLGNLGVLSVASTGYALVKDTTLSSGALEVSGVAEFKNTDFTNVGNISVNGGHLLVDEGSRFDSNGSTGTLQVSAGGTMDIKNNSEVRTYYLFGSGAGITVEQGSTLYFDKWTTG